MLQNCPPTVKRVLIARAVGLGDGLSDIKLIKMEHAELANSETGMSWSRDQDRCGPTDGTFLTLISRKAPESLV